MKGQRIQAEFIRKRDLQTAHFERTNSVQKYYDKMQRITSLHEHWSTPEYQKESEEKLRKRVEFEERQRQLSERQKHLKTLLDDETKRLNAEVQENQRPKFRQAPINILESVRQTLSNAEEGRKRADLESTLYSRWRLGMDQEKILRESKTNHHAMAKLSWLDRQLENQLENERQKKENNLLELKLHEEKRKHEEYLTNCNKQRENELTQVKSIQEDHVNELKNRDRELHELKLTENTLRKKLDEIKKEKSNLSAVNTKRRDRIEALHNYRKIKMMLRGCSETVRRHLQQDLNLLDRLSFDHEFDNNEEINFLKLKIQGQYDKEVENCRFLETMYESEAKEAMRKQIEKWDDESMVRERQLFLLMEDRHQVISERINECVRRQKEVEDMREIHAKAIDNSTQRLREIMDATMTSGLLEASAKPFMHVSSTNHTDGLIKKTNDLIINEIPSELCLPKYGRKKVAWT